MEICNADVLIVGAGMAGVSLAYELASRCSVLLIEREQMPGYHATGRSAAMFLPQYGPDAVRALSRASRGFFDAPPPGLANTPLLIRRGAVVIGGEHQVDVLRAAHDPAVEQWLGGDAVRAMVPVLRPEGVAAGLFDDRATDIEVATLHQGYWKGARERGAAGLFNLSVEAIERSAEGWRIDTPTHSLRAPVLVNAAGAWADDLAQLCGLAPAGLQPMRRTAALIRPPSGFDIRDWPLVITVDESLYFKPDAGLLLVSPADETPAAPCDAQPEELDIAIAIDRLQQVADIAVRRVEHSWAGLRTFAADRCPLVGFAPDDSGCFWFAGQGGYGIQMAPALARLGAALLMGDGIPDSIAAEGFDLAAVAPTRFAMMSPS